MPIGPVKSESLVEKILERLEFAIMSGEIQSGARLSEHRLAAELGVSRGPLREALSRLEGRRLIQRIPNIGARVVGTTVRDLHEILLIREALEGVACRLAAEKLTDEDLAELTALVERHEENVDREASAYTQSPDFDFHQRIIRASDNQQLIRLLCEDLFYLLRVHRYRSATVPGRAKQALAEHRVILAALKARDPESAENAMRRHLRQAYLNLVAMSGEATGGEPASSGAAARGRPRRARTRRQADLTDTP